MRCVTYGATLVAWELGQAVLGGIRSDGKHRKKKIKMQWCGGGAARGVPRELKGETNASGGVVDLAAPRSSLRDGGDLLAERRPLGGWQQVERRPPARCCSLGQTSPFRRGHWSAAVGPWSAANGRSLLPCLATRSAVPARRRSPRRTPDDIKNRKNMRIKSEVERMDVEDVALHHLVELERVSPGLAELHHMERGRYLEHLEEEQAESSVDIDM
ncbi:hypothetical protein GW17_00020232 [Ensete ventricosum]|nr:hypothetical protein GW17_00020232 [Ensete ventricosum]